MHVSERKRASPELHQRQDAVMGILERGGRSVLLLFLAAQDCIAGRSTQHVTAGTALYSDALIRMRTGTDYAHQVVDTRLNT